MKWNKRRAVILLLALFIILPTCRASAGNDGEVKEKPYHGWYTDIKTGKRYYYDKDGELHYGWLRYVGHWYYFTVLGNMVDDGYRSIDGEQYFFYNTGQLAAGTYVGLHYMDENGVHVDEHDIRLIGKGDVTMYDRDMITDALYYVPQKWVTRFVKEGWELMYYTKKKYLEAPDTDLGIYYVYHKLDPTYKKLKFTKPDDLVRGFGEYIGYTLGLYKEGNEDMAIMWGDEMTVADMEEIPNYYEDDPAFYFGILCKLYWDSETTKELQEAAPDTYAVLKDLLQ